MSVYEEAKAALYLYQDKLAEAGDLLSAQVVNRDQSWVIEAVYSDKKPVDAELINILGITRVFYEVQKSVPTPEPDAVQLEN